jgi:tight adherence protein C
MNPAITIPLFIALIALLVANEDFQWERFALDKARTIQDRTSVKARVIELGANPIIGYENFRLKQIALITAALISLLLCTAFFGFNLALFLIAVLLSPVLIIFLTERKLTMQVVQLRKQIDAELPAALEMILLALSAGETPVGSIKRISRRAEGPLAEHLGMVISEVESGAPFTDSLDALSRRLNSIPIRRFIDALIIAISRGAPLMEVLSSQIEEARNNQRNRVLAAAGKAEISMMIPVVFLILPISILFALWPSLSGLNLFSQ